ncbi:unnamed protein product [Arabis nemorensis]|uniref:RSE1/DDB1/CPSF1 first beta-propeller domain-containing protein n=1 Tax=Arabis nemorensis TaxID=586526 RepID=A0A565BVI4_9BRAS|nr:unnamed protein product [Arabis nemorensis]
MYLYSLTLQQATEIISAINGGRRRRLRLLVGRSNRPDENGKIQTIHSVQVFGAIRSLAQFRLTCAQKDYIVVGSDSGKIVMLEYNKEKNVFDEVSSLLRSQVAEELYQASTWLLIPKGEQ